MNTACAEEKPAEAQETRKQKTSTQKTLLRAAFALCICVAVGAAAYLGRYYYHVFIQWRHEREVRGMYEDIISHRADNPWPELPSPDVRVMPPDNPPDSAGDDDGETESEWERERRRLEEMEALGRELFADFLGVNEDFRGIFSIPNLISPLPYVHSRDNEDYLNRDFNGRTTPVGAVFLNVWNDRLLTDRNTVLYGHNVRAGQMFAPLLRYKQADTFQRAPVVRLDSLTGETVWIVFAAYVTEPDWGYVDPSDTRDGFSDLLEEIKARSLFVTEVDVNADDRILTLSTCDYTHEDMRFAVHARLLRPGEAIPESVAAAANPDPKPFNIPSRKPLPEIAASRAAVMLHPTTNKLYFYQTRDGGIDWYSGNTSVVQGVYSNYTGGVTEDSFIAAVYDSDQDNRKLYIAVDGFNDRQGVHLLTNRLPSGNLVYDEAHGLVTPWGVDARYPALAHDGGSVWLLYAVAGEDGEELYRRRLQDSRASGEPELLLTLPPDSEARPLGVYTVDGMPLLLWHETANSRVCGRWENGEAFTLPLAGGADRVTLYGTVSNGVLRAAAEKDGGFTFHTLNLADWPRPAPSPPLPPEPPSPPEPSETPEPSEPPSPPEPSETPEPSKDGEPEPD
ncbi:MAG: class B sortase [Oscillospiraceae bacterium]|nr:class B sortase [Oscillospiraceae bacterium]